MHPVFFNLAFLVFVRYTKKGQQGSYLKDFGGFAATAIDQGSRQDR
jgi:hypothetical protein